MSFILFFLNALKRIFFLNILWKILLLIKFVFIQLVFWFLNEIMNLKCNLFWKISLIQRILVWHIINKLKITFQFKTIFIFNLAVSSWILLFFIFIQFVHVFIILFVFMILCWCFLVYWRNHLTIQLSFLWLNFVWIIFLILIILIYQCLFLNVLNIFTEGVFFNRVVAHEVKLFNDIL